jgi:hypothetical protein
MIRRLIVVTLFTVALVKYAMGDQWTADLLVLSAWILIAIGLRYE